MDEWSSAFTFSGHNSWSRPQPHLSRDEQESLMHQLEIVAREGRVYDIIQLSLRILSTDHLTYDMIFSALSHSLNTAFANFDRLNNDMQSNNVEALTEAFVMACYRGQLDDVRRLSHVVRDDVNMLGVGLHFALLQRTGLRNKEHWNVIKWLMDNTQLQDNPLVLRRAFVEACRSRELEEVRWMLQYRELARDTDTIDRALGYARSRHLALVKCVVEHADVDVNGIRRVDTLLHDVIWMCERLSDLHSVCYNHQSVADVYRLVYERGANVNEQDSYSNTPLHVACLMGNQDIVEALMSCGADVNITNNNKRTPAQEAIYREHEELLPLLDRTSLMDTLRRRRLKLTIKNCISVHLTALFVHSIIDFRILASIRLLFD
jgi:hypothetical protein